MTIANSKLTIKIIAILTMVMLILPMICTVTMPFGILSQAQVQKQNKNVTNIMTKDITLEKIEVLNTIQNEKIIVKYHTRNKNSKQKTINQISYTKEQIVIIENGLAQAGVKIETKTSGWGAVASRAWSVLSRFWNWLWPYAVKGYWAVVDACWGRSWLARAIGVSSCWEFGSVVLCMAFRWGC